MAGNNWSEVRLTSNAWVVSVDIRRRILQRKMWWDAGWVSYAETAPGYRARMHGGFCGAYRGNAMDMIYILLESIRREADYVVIYEDDAVPAHDIRARWEEVRQQVPSDCGILALGDINGESIVRGKETLLYDRIRSPFTRLVPLEAENKGAHAYVVMRCAMEALVQALMAQPVSDLALARAYQYDPRARAYGLQQQPLFAQHRLCGLRPPHCPVRLCERDRWMQAHGASYQPEEHWALPRLSRIMELEEDGASKEVTDVYILSNGRHGRIPLYGEPLIVHLNTDSTGIFGEDDRHVLICRSDARDARRWFTPRDLCLADWRGVLMPTEAEWQSYIPEYATYRRRSDKIPSTGWLAWMLCRKQYPHAEIHLVDFAPGGDIGTPKWRGHDWELEERVYRQAGVDIVRTI